MPDQSNERRRLVRARQRDPNSSLRGFDPKLEPILAEIGVDRLQVRVDGSFSFHAGTFPQFAQNILDHEGWSWFNRPSGPDNFKTLELSSGATTTIRKLKATLRGTTQPRGTVRVEASLNPTATLANLMIAHLAAAHDPQFISRLRELDPVHFFSTGASDQLATSFDGRDNWLPYHLVSQQTFGHDFWEQFLQIFVHQFRMLMHVVLSEHSDPRVTTSGARDTVISGDGQIEIEWDGANVPQVECYFERFHASAATAVRRGGWIVLSADHTANLQQYIGNARFERDNDRLAVSLKVNERNRLSIYAKLADRIRFELERHGKGDYRTLPLAEAPTQRLTDILLMERENALALIRWRAIGELFAGPDYPDVHDLQVLIRHITRAVGDNEILLSEWMTKLLYDGSIEESWATSSRENRQAMSALKAVGVLEKKAIRRRDMSKAGRNGRRPRLHLTAGYRDIHILFTDPLLQV